MTTETEEGYWSTLTQLGEEEYNQAQLENRAVPYTYIVFGDGGGAYVAPDKTRTALVSEVHRAPITAAYTKPENPNWLYLETVVPATEGGWWVREIGALTSTGKLVVIGSYAPAYKPKLGETAGLIGVRADLKVTLVVETTSSAPAELVVDSSAVFATLASIASGIEAHQADPDAHSKATTERFGFTRIATLEETVGVDEEVARDDIAVSPAGLKGVLDGLAEAMPSDSMPSHLLAQDPHPQYLKTTAPTYISESRAVTKGVYLVDTSTGPTELQLPATPAKGDIFTFMDAAASWGVQNLVITRNGNTIMGHSDDLVVNVSNQQFSLWFNGSDWRLL